MHDKKKIHVINSVIESQLAEPQVGLEGLSITPDWICLKCLQIKTNLSFNKSYLK